MEEPLENFLELVNEISILLCAYTMNVFSNTAINSELSGILGWTFLVIAVINIAINVAALTVTQFIGFGRDIQTKRMEYRKNKVLKARMVNLRKIQELNPKSARYIQKEIDTQTSVL
jgi:hypothetical protein